MKRKDNVSITKRHELASHANLLPLWEMNAQPLRNGRFSIGLCACLCDVQWS